MHPAGQAADLRALAVVQLELRLDRASFGVLADDRSAALVLDSAVLDLEALGFATDFGREIVAFQRGDFIEALADFAGAEKVLLRLQH